MNPLMEKRFRKKLNVMKRFILILSLFMFLASVEAKVWISHPTVEGRTEPLGLDMSTPRLGWILQSDER